jgi:hypothetical protein
MISLCAENKSLKVECVIRTIALRLESNLVCFSMKDYDMHDANRFLGDLLKEARKEKRKKIILRSVLFNENFLEVAGFAFQRIMDDDGLDLIENLDLSVFMNMPSKETEKESEQVYKVLSEIRYLLDVALVFTCNKVREGQRRILYNNNFN